MTAHEALRALWAIAGGEREALGSVTFEGEDPVLPSNFRLGAAAMASIAASGLAVAEWWQLISGTSQCVTVDARRAATAFRSERYLRIDGAPPPPLWDDIAGFYRAGDGRWVQLHTNFPHHRDAVLRVLGCGGEREDVARAIARRPGESLAETVTEAGGCASLVRRPDEWRAHAQARAVSRLPLLEILPIGTSRPERPSPGERPLGAVRVLDLSRILAGPICGRTLAEHGAQVMRVGARHLPSIAPLVVDTGRGKLSAFLDLRDSGDAERLRELARTADVFIQAYRPGALGRLGFSPERLAELRPGIVYVTLSAYGHVGPWAARRGFDSLVQSASGIAWEGGQAVGLDEPRHLPAQALDHATGYLAAFGAVMALRRRATEGGSYLVRVSLAQTARWLDGLGRVDGSSCPDPGLDDVRDWLQNTDSLFGRLTHTVPGASLSRTPAYWARPAVPLGTHPPVWPERGQSS